VIHDSCINNPADVLKEAIVSIKLSEVIDKSRHTKACKHSSWLCQDFWKLYVEQLILAQFENVNDENFSWCSESQQCRPKHIDLVHFIKNICIHLHVNSDDFVVSYPEKLLQQIKMLNLINEHTFAELRIHAIDHCWKVELAHVLNLLTSRRNEWLLVDVKSSLILFRPNFLFFFKLCVFLVLFGLHKNAYFRLLWLFVWSKQPIQQISLWLRIVILFKCLLKDITEHLALKVLRIDAWRFTSWITFSLAVRNRRIPTITWMAWLLVVFTFSDFKLLKTLFDITKLVLQRVLLLLWTYTSFYSAFRRICRPIRWINFRLKNIL